MMKCDLSYLHITHNFDMEITIFIQEIKSVNDALLFACQSMMPCYLLVYGHIETLLREKCSENLTRSVMDYCDCLKQIIIIYPRNIYYTYT